MLGHRAWPQEARRGPVSHCTRGDVSSGVIGEADWHGNTLANIQARGGTEVNHHWRAGLFGVLVKR
eukprot:3962078-Alexandrium_andersonii.AAC.1